MNDFRNAEFFEAKIDRNPDSEKVAKWETRIAEFEARIAELEAGLETTTQKITKPAAPQEPTSARSADTAPPQFVPATLDMNDGTLTVVFDETIDFSEVRLGNIQIQPPGPGTTLGLDDATFDASAPDSDTLTLTITQADRDTITDNPGDTTLHFFNAVKDLAGNSIGRVSNLPLTIIPATEEPPADTTPPTVLSATLDLTAETLTIVFDEAVDFSQVYLEEIGLGRYTLAGASFDAAAPDSDTLVLGGHRPTVDTVLGLANPALDLGRNSVRDTSGNGLQAVTVPITLANVPVPDATVTITAAGTFVEDAGTIDIQLGGDMTIDVRFVNEHGSDHTVLADLISWRSWHAGADIPIPSGQSSTHSFTINPDAPCIGTDNENANVYLVFGVEDDKSTVGVNEAYTITGDHAIKVRITEPAS